jgi:hypothetical protein
MHLEIDRVGGPDHALVAREARDSGKLLHPHPIVLRMGMYRGRKILKHFAKTGLGLVCAYFTRR